MKGISSQQWRSKPVSIRKKKSGSPYVLSEDKNLILILGKLISRKKSPVKKFRTSTSNIEGPPKEWQMKQCVSNIKFDEKQESLTNLE